jgi:hypothetical protein
VIALLASSWGAPAIAAASFAAVVAGATLGATWDHTTTRLRHYYAPGSHRR